MPKLPNKQMSVEHEDFIADTFNGKRERASGASITAPGDVYVPRSRSLYDENLLIECKVTEGGSITISRKVVLKIIEEASLRGARPMLALRWRDPYTGKHIDVIGKLVDDEQEDLSMRCGH